MKRIMSIILLLLFTLTSVAAAVPATSPQPGTSAQAGSNINAASSGTSGAVDERLTAVTLKVKQTLNIGDEYSSFYGDLEEKSFLPFWRLTWQSDNRNLSVIADENGKIYSYNIYDTSTDYPEPYYYNGYFAPSFPKVSRTAAENIAKDFLSTVLTDTEDFVFTDNNNYLRASYNVSHYYFYAQMLLNGVPSPVNINISISLSDLTVANFSRDDLYYGIRGEIPTAKAEISSNDAASTLAEIYELEPYYILTDYTDKEARLVYIPQHSSNYVVDAKSGKLVELHSAVALYGNAGAPEGSAMAEDAGGYMGGLSPAELEGISKMEGVLTKEQLDATVRGLDIFGVNDDFINEYMNYSLDNTSGEVTVYINYVSEIKNRAEYGITEEAWKTAEQSGYKTLVYRSFTLDGKTGAIKGVNTYYSGIYDRYTEIEAVTLPKAVEDYLKKAHAKELNGSALYSERGEKNAITQYHYNFCRQENGYFYTGNSLNVTVNPANGVIDNLHSYWEDDITFAPSDKIVAPEDAVDVYSDAFEYRLSYVLNNSEVNQSNYTYTYELLLAYSAYYDGYVTGVDAVNGELIAVDSKYGAEEISYDDISDSYAREQIEKLAEYGIGFRTKQFSPKSVVTEKDMLAFLLSVEGYSVINDDDAEWDKLYRRAYELGILTRNQREPERMISRAELAKVLIKMSGYGISAELPGIYICGYSDDADIPAEFYGYVAIAKGMGVISGGNIAFRPNAAVSRQEMAVMMFNFMSRA